MGGLGSWASAKGGGFDDDAHPRDDQGRFTSSGGAAVSRDTANAPKRSFTDHLPDGMKAESWMGNYDAHPDLGGKPTDARYKDVHAPIIREALDVEKPQPGEHKVAIFTMGAPASGKSSGLKGVDTSRFVKVDPDSIKEQIPEYKRATDPASTYRGAAFMAHEESSAIAKEIMNRAVADGKHVLVDGTGTNAKSMTDKMSKLKQAGYKIHLVMSHGTLDTGLKRAHERAEKTGRVVPDDVIRKGYEQVPKNFQEIGRFADTFAVRDGTREGSPLVWEKHQDGSETHHDKQFVARFKHANYRAS